MSLHMYYPLLLSCHLCYLNTEYSFLIALIITADMIACQCKTWAIITTMQAVF